MPVSPKHQRKIKRIVLRKNKAVADRRYEKPVNNHPTPEMLWGSQSSLNIVNVEGVPIY